ncbi:hypothetical protein [Streptomyces sp. NPDC048665]|uniref:hypothetical protein n=1 Tax=Streptomyces sp. NPDC048665 TaxID=3155490 RepID=UPI00343FDDAA
MAPVTGVEAQRRDLLLAARIGLDGFEAGSSVRTWLHRIATNRCLNALRTIRRRPVPAEPSAASRPGPSRLGESLWLQAYSDFLFDCLPDQNPDPALILRDVLGHRTAATAELLGLTESATDPPLTGSTGGAPWSSLQSYPEHGPVHGRSVSLPADPGRHATACPGPAG